MVWGGSVLGGEGWWGGRRGTGGGVIGVGSRYSIFDTPFGDPLESQRSMYKTSHPVSFSYDISTQGYQPSRFLLV